MPGCLDGMKLLIDQLQAARKHRANAILSCRAEDEKYSQSKAAQQRAEALQRAQEQAAENERNAKQAAREAFQRQR